ncbi:MAG: hypothetical protein KKH88_03940 [Nanoarchaeota archaeon]|nr:hypothetical protein [Nanoarchaeota archaeon]
MVKIKANTIIELAGFPKEHIENSMQDVIKKVKELKGIKIIKSETAETKQNKEFFSIFTEFEIEFSDFDSLLIYSFNFMPSSIDILEPENLSIKLEDLQYLLNDLIGKLHQYDMGVKKLLLENRALKNQLTAQKS